MSELIIAPALHIKLNSSGFNLCQSLSVVTGTVLTLESSARLVSPACFACFDGVILFGLSFEYNTNAVRPCVTHAFVVF